MSCYPSPEEVAAKTGERLLEMKRSPRSMLGLLSWSAFTFIIAMAFILYYPLSWFFSFLLVPVGFAVEAVRRYHDDLYVIERERVVHKGGRLSLKYSIPVIHIRDIRAVAVVQSFIGRLFDYGNLELNTAAQDQGELVIEGVRSPDELGEIIEYLRRDLEGEGAEFLSREESGE